MRYRAAKSLDPNTMTTFRDLIPTKLAAGIWNCLMKYKSNLPNFPQSETCDLLILDRSIDQVFICSLSITLSPIVVAILTFLDFPKCHLISESRTACLYRTFHYMLTERQAIIILLILEFQVQSWENS